MKIIHLLSVITALTAAVGALAQVPSIINYQGRLSAGGTNGFNGPGQFKFALVNGGTNLNQQATATATVSGGFVTEIILTDGGSGYAERPAVAIIDATGSNATATATVSGGAVTSISVGNPGRHYSDSPTVTIAAPPPNYAYVTFWSNDGSSTGGGEPGQAVPLLVNQGLFSVNLGDTGLSNMTAVIPTSIFTNSDLRLRIWFSDGVAAFQQFYPDQRLTSAGYAMMAANVPDGSVTSAKLAVGAVNTTSVAAYGISSVNVASGAITLDKLDPAAASILRPPIGSVIAWLKGQAGTPGLPSEWVECNGQLVTDAASPYNGQSIPNLNGFGGITQRFLRGSTNSGAIGGEDMHVLTIAEMPSHHHNNPVWVNAAAFAVSAVGYFPQPGTPPNSGALTENTGGGTAHETRPPFYEVVWIMRIK